MATNFHTHKLIAKLVAEGMPASQAEEVSAALEEIECVLGELYRNHRIGPQAAAVWFGNCMTELTSTTKEHRQLSPHVWDMLERVKSPLCARLWAQKPAEPEYRVISAEKKRRAKRLRATANRLIREAINRSKG